MIEKIEKIIKENLGLDNLKIDSSTSFKDDLDLDSFEMAQLLCAFEDEFDVTIDDEKLTQISTVAELIKEIEG